MRTGRPTADKKDHIVKARINDEMYEHLVVIADQGNVTVSDVIRHCLQEFIDRCMDEH